jgi:hypothetical protein
VAERETAAIQAAYQVREDAARELAAAATARAERAETALDAERTERCALTAALAQARTRNRPAAPPKNGNQSREAQLRVVGGLEIVGCCGALRISGSRQPLVPDTLERP